jgi:hypothetical protein
LLRSPNTSDPAGKSTTAGQTLVCDLKLSDTSSERTGPDTTNSLNMELKWSDTFADQWGPEFIAILKRYTLPEMGTRNLTW